jgi:hypothetical protein
MGWPLPCLYGRYVATESKSGVQVESASGAIVLMRTVAYSGPWSTVQTDVAMPLVPQSPGFAACVALYGLAAFVLARAPRWVKSWFRRRRGACATCGYDLRGTPERCPECGTPAGALVANRPVESD